MTFDADDHFRKLKEAHQIWDDPQFLMPEVCKITGATPKALEHFVNPARGMVRLMGDWVNPGTGKRRRFSGEQVLKIAAAYTMSHIGFPQRWSIELSEAVARRAIGRTNGLATKTKMGIITYPIANADWAVVPVYAEDEVEPKVPLAVQYLDVDRLIDQVLAQLRAIVAGEDIPDFTVPDIVPEPDPYGPIGNFFKAWTKDQDGNWLLVGLTYAETLEYMRLQGWALNGDDLTYFDVPYDPATLDRSVELRSKHEVARAQACFGEFQD